MVFDDVPEETRLWNPDTAPQEILVVGDTKNDMIFAHMCGGTGIGVLSGLAKKEDFAGEADEILTSIGELPAYLERN